MEVTTVGIDLAKNLPVGSVRSTYHVAPREFETERISLVAAQWVIFGSLWSGVLRRTAAHTGISRISLQNIRNRGLVGRAR